MNIFRFAHPDGFFQNWMNSKGKRGQHATLPTFERKLSTSNGMNGHACCIRGMVHGQHASIDGKQWTTLYLTPGLLQSVWNMESTSLFQKIAG